METVTIGDIVGKTFSTWRRNFLSFTTLSLICNSPVILIHVLYYVNERPVSEFSADSIGLMLLGMFLGIVLTGALTYGVLQSLSGQPASIGASVGKGFKRLVPVFLVTLLFTFCFAAGLVLLFVPGIIVFCGLCLSVPVVVMEKVGPITALQRSWVLTRGQRGRIFASVMLLYIIVGTFAMLAIAPWYIVRGPTDPLATLANAVFTALLGPLGSITPAILYFLIRSNKEGGQLDQLAAVFE